MGDRLTLLPSSSINLPQSPQERVRLFRDPPPMTSMSKTDTLRPHAAYRTFPSTLSLFYNSRRAVDCLLYRNCWSNNNVTNFPEILVDFNQSPVKIRFDSDCNSIIMHFHPILAILGPSLIIVPVRNLRHNCVCRQRLRPYDV